MSASLERWWNDTVDTEVLRQRPAPAPFCALTEDLLNHCKCRLAVQQILQFQNRYLSGPVALRSVRSHTRPS